MLWLATLFRLIDVVDVSLRQGSILLADDGRHFIRPRLRLRIGR